MPTQRPGEIAIIHYHFRPGGVRRLIELLLPQLALRFERVTLVGGEPPDPDWRELVARAAPRARFAINRSIGYLDPQEAPHPGRRREIRQFLDRHLGRGSLAWIHNPALGRNVLLAAELAALAAERDIPLVCHHHDFWCDGRWARWPEMRAAGLRSLASVGRAVFAAGARAVHAGINSEDSRLLARGLPCTAWLPNPIDTTPPPSRARVREARKWMAGRLGSDAPVWIYPARFLRRKNPCEAILISRWLNPTGWFVLTGAPSSPVESAFADTLRARARRAKWNVRLGLLENVTHKSPPVRDLIHASEALVMTSIQEGFGFPYLEGAASGRRVIARKIPRIHPDLLNLGVILPGLYDDILVPTGLFDARAEVRRQLALHRAWVSALPRTVRQFAAAPGFLSDPSRATAFSRLTPAAQIEVLSLPPPESLAACLPLNPFLHTLAEAALPEPPDAGFLSPQACAERLASLAFPEQPVTAGQAEAAQNAILSERTGPASVFPLLLG